MARDISSTKLANISATVTRPVYLVEWQHSGVTEYLSCSGTITYDGQAYTAGGLTITSMVDGKTATIVLPATAARITEIQNNTWRLGTCKITAVLAAPGDSPTYTAADGDLMLDGVIETSSFSGESITVVAKCKYYRGALVPRFTFSDAISATPAVGTTSTWEGENYSYEQWLKTTAAIQRLTRPGVNPQVFGRPSTTQINSFAPIEDTGYKLLTAQGVNIPIVYGRDTVPGYIFVEGEFGSSKLVGVAWCLGEVYSVEKVFINDEEIPATVIANHYRGTTTQTVSTSLQTYTATSPLYSDDLVLRTPAGNVGICYSVFLIPPSIITGAPRFRAIIQGRLVADPSSTATDPYYDNTEWSFDFLTGVTDSGPNAYTLTLNGNAGIASPSLGLALDGTGDYATIPDGTAIGLSPFTLEIEFSTATAASSPGVTETLICQGATASPLSRSLQIDRTGDELLLYLSSDGATWDIADGITCGIIAGGTSPETIGRLVVERVDNQFTTYLDGVIEGGVISSAALYDSGSVWELGASGGAQEWTGVIRSARLTIGAYRYGSSHTITNTPFSDTGNYTAGVVYSENPALAWNDLAKDPIIGLGATTTGVADAAAYCDSAMTSGAPRCRIGLTISEPRLVEAWLDQLAMYANAMWFPEGSNLKIIPDKIKDGTNGSGFELYTPTSPEFGSPLPTITTEDGVSYSVSVEITAISTTSPLTGVSVTFGGVTIITSVTSLGVHGATVTASGTSNTIEVIEDVGFDGTWANLSVKRTHRLIDKWLPSTLSLQGAPEGDKPNAVVAKYKVPNELSGAWDQKTFGVQNAEVTAGNPIVLTTLDLQGVNRIEEASNKAIATLYRNDSKTMVSLISTDEEVVCQPGDTVQIVGANRGIDTPIFVESNRMVSYGRHQITGTIYRDNQYPDTDYTEIDQIGTFVDGGYVEENVGGPACVLGAYYTKLETEGLIVPETAVTVNSLDWPFATSTSDPDVMFAYVLYISSPNIVTSFAGSAGSAGYPKGYPSTWGWTSGAENSSFQFCSKTITECLNIYENGTVMAIKPQRSGLAGSAYNKGDYAFVATIAGHNGTDFIDAFLVRNSSRVWDIFCSGKTFTNATVDISVRISSSGSSGSRTQTLSIVIGGSTVYSASIGSIGYSWTTVAVAVQSGTPYQDNFDGSLYHHYIPATVTVSLQGDLISQVVQVTGQEDLTSGGPFLSTTEKNTSFYTTPEFFRASQVSVAGMGGGLWDYDVTNATDTVAFLTSN